MLDIVKLTTLGLGLVTTLYVTCMALVYLVYFGSLDAYNRITARNSLLYKLEFSTILGQLWKEVTG